MKITRSLICGLVLCLCLLPRPCMAQQKTELDLLWGKIEELEKVDQEGMSPLMVEFHEKAMLKQYMELSTCLDREIETAARQRIQAGTDAVSSMDQRLRNLNKQRLQVAGRITILRTLLGSTEEIARLDTTAAGGRRPTADSAQGVRSRQTAASMNAVGESASATVTVSAPTDAAPTTTAASVAASTAGAPIQSCGPSVIYTNAPEILSDLATNLAIAVINANDPDLSVQAGTQMVLYTLLDAASARSSELIHGLEAYRYIGETARTDKQLGSSGDSDGAVSAIEKPGFAQLLGFALEHGGITKENDGTNLTLSTSLYSLYALGTKDTAENYARAGILNRVGVAATFAVDNKDNELANARRNNLSQWSAKVRLFGDRSSRSPGFQKMFAEKIKPAIQARLRSLGRPMEALATSNAGYNALEDAALTDLPNQVRARMACPDYIAADADQKQQILGAVILGRLHTAVYGPVHNHTFNLDANDLGRIEQEFLPNIKEALDAYVLADTELKNIFSDLQRGPLLTFAYTNHRIPTASDYSETKFLFEQDKGLFAPLKLSTNVGVSFYNRPNRSLNQQKTRDFSAALSFEGASDSPFTEAENKSKITYSFVGRYQRLFENRGVRGRTADIGTLQFITEVPLFKGLSIPFSVTYSSATEEEKKQGFRFNFGTRLDMDKLFDLLRANSKL